MSKASKECANYNVGNCLGAIITNTGYQYINKDMVGKCKPDSCEYFNNIVVKGVIQK